MKQTISPSRPKQRYAAVLALSLGILAVLPFQSTVLENLDKTKNMLFTPVFLLIDCTANHLLRKESELKHLLIITLSIGIFDLCNLFFLPVNWMVYVAQMAVIGFYLVYQKKSAGH